MKSKTALLAIVLLAMQVYAPLDLYVPSLPYIARYFHAEHAIVQQTVTWCLLGLGLVQWVSGPMMERYGHKKITLLGLMLGIIGPMIIMISPNMYWLIVGRFVQGCSSGIMLMSARVMMLKCFAGRDVYHAAAWMGLAIGAAHVICPMIGGYIQYHLTWRYNFVVLFIVAAVVFIFVWVFIDEALTKKTQFTVVVMIQKNRMLLRRKEFWGGSLILSVSLSMSMAFNLFTSFLIQNVMHYGPIIYGYLVLLVSVFYLLGVAVTKQLLRWIEPILIIKAALIAMVVVGTLMLILSLCGIFSIYLIMIPACAIAMLCGISMPNIAAYCLSFFKDIAGLSSGIIGAVTGIIAALLTVLLTGFKPVVIWPLAGYLFLGSVAIYFLYQFLLIEKGAGKGAQPTPSLL